MPEPMRERPSYKKRQAQWLLHQAAGIAVASTHDDDGRRHQEVERPKAEAVLLLAQRINQMQDLERAAWRPPTQHTQSAWGASQGEPLPLFARAMRRTMLELGVSRELADQMVDPGAPEQGKGKGKGQNGKGGNK